jgi:apolipoprotein N-acyltransferase
MDRGRYVNNVYGTETASTKESVLVTGFWFAFGAVINFSFWLFFGLGVWNSLLVPAVGFQPISLSVGGVLLAGLMLGRSVFCLKS